MSEVDIGAIADLLYSSAMAMPHYNVVISLSGHLCRKVAETIVWTIVLGTGMVATRARCACCEPNSKIRVNPSVQPLRNTIAKNAPQQQVASVVVGLTIAMTHV
jgi:hypothetical protein